MKGFSLIILLFAGLARGEDNLISVEEIWDTEPPASPTWELERAWDLGQGNRFLATFHFTKKGNGWLSLGPDLQLRVHDSHGDRFTYKGDILNLKLEDLNSDGFKDLSVSGIVQNWGEQGDYLGDRFISGAFLYNPQIGFFEISEVSDTQLIE